MQQPKVNELAATLGKLMPKYIPIIVVPGMEGVYGVKL